MSIAVHYRSFIPLEPRTVAAVTHAAEAFNAKYVWIACEPIAFDSLGEDGYLVGSSKFGVPADEPVPPGEEHRLADLHTLGDGLAALSGGFGFDWELNVGGDHPLGQVVDGLVDETLRASLDVLGTMSDDVDREIDDTDL